MFSRMWARDGGFIVELHPAEVVQLEQGPSVEAAMHSELCAGAVRDFEAVSFHTSI